MSPKFEENCHWQNFTRGYPYNRKKEAHNFILPMESKSPQLTYCDCTGSCECLNAAMEENAMGPTSAPSMTSSAPASSSSAPTAGETSSTSASSSSTEDSKNSNKAFAGWERVKTTEDFWTVGRLRDYWHARLQLPGPATTTKRCRAPPEDTEEEASLIPRTKRRKLEEDDAKEEEEDDDLEDPMPVSRRLKNSRIQVTASSDSTAATGDSPTPKSASSTPKN